jgi:hypothetical protein
LQRLSEGDIEVALTQFRATEEKPEVPLLDISSSDLREERTTIREILERRITARSIGRWCMAPGLAT